MVAAKYPPDSASFEGPFLCAVFWNWWHNLSKPFTWVVVVPTSLDHRGRFVLYSRDEHFNAAGGLAVQIAE